MDSVKQKMYLENERENEGKNQKSTNIRPEISKDDKYYISKQRYYELKHFCLQHAEWKRVVNKLEVGLPLHGINYLPKKHSEVSDPTAQYAMLKAEFKTKMELVKNTSIAADAELADYIFRAVTENMPYSYMKENLKIPCCRDVFYERYRRFFWLLSQVRG